MGYCLATTQAKVRRRAEGEHGMKLAVHYMFVVNKKQPGLEFDILCYMTSKRNHQATTTIKDVTCKVCLRKMEKLINPIYSVLVGAINPRYIPGENIKLSNRLRKVVCTP